jgi:hypothetical protein
LQHLNGVTYSDVLKMPTYERRFFLGLLTKDMQQRKENADQNAQTKQSKGSRTTKISGEQLKSKLKSGEIPNK